MGTKVLLKKRVRGRNKIQDFYDPTLYIVTGTVTEDGNAVIVEKVTDGTVRVVNRTNLIEYDFSDSESEQEALTRTESQVRISESESSSEGEIITITRKPMEEVGRRRSKRTTAGQHRNPHRLPETAVSQEVTATAPISYVDFSNAISNLSSTLGSTLSTNFGKLLQEEFAKCNK